MTSCAACKALLQKLTMGLWPTERNEVKKVVMAKVIEFYVPKNFRKPLKWAPQLQLGRVVEFCSLTKKSA